MGAWADPPQPGPYVFRLPLKMGNIWDKAEKTFADGRKEPRLKAKFDTNNPLTIVQSPGGALDNEPFETQLTNVERKRGKADSDTQEISDMDFLLRDGFGVEKRPRINGKITNKAYGEALVQFANQTFGANVTWSWRCREDRPIRVENADGGYEEVPEQMGCGARYYQKNVDKVPSNPDDPNSPKVYPLRITCTSPGCGANLRAFANLESFRRPS